MQGQPQPVTWLRLISKNYGLQLHWDVTGWLAWDHYHDKRTQAGKKACVSLPCSAISISLRPNSACLMFLTQKSLLPLELFCCLSLGDVSSSELSV